ncbi:hypothetical protein HY405_02080 [Candidatus Microgenomates bacterium]|nr:hypothetical protein [Candidatus Microgenomates bacterium]
MGLSKTTWLIIGAVAILVVAGATVAFLYFSQGQSLLSSAKRPLQTIPPLTVETPTTELETQAQATYKDTAGFTFKYPTNIIVTDATPEDDDSYYTLLNLANNGEKMTVAMTDTEYKTVDDWLSKDSQAPKSPTLIGAISLDGVAARQYTTGARLITVAVDKNVLYVFESPKDGSSWDKTHDLLTSTFKFEKAQSASGGGSSSNTVYEAEEVVE